MGYEKGLVHTTHNILNGGEQRVLRPRVLIYSCILLLLISGLLYSIITRVPLELGVIHDRNKLYSETYDGMIENIYTLKLINKSQRDHGFRLTVTSIEGISLASDRKIFPVAGSEAMATAVRLRADPYLLPSASVSVDFRMQAIDDENLYISEDAKFLDPFRK